MSGLGIDRREKRPEEGVNRGMPRLLDPDAMPLMLSASIPQFCSLVWIEWI